MLIPLFAQRIVTASEFTAELVGEGLSRSITFKDHNWHVANRAIRHERPQIRAQTIRLRFNVRASLLETPTKPDTFGTHN